MIKKITIAKTWFFEMDPGNDKAQTHDKFKIENGDNLKTQHTCGKVVVRE